jgi:Holliday junction resolvase
MVKFLKIRENEKMTISNEQLEELVKLAPFAQTQLPIATQASNLQLKVSVIRAREKYRRLSFELAGDLAKELLVLRTKAMDPFL